ncbi:hypothetical protein WN55_02690 [Dufourea novaeangliae]|uniref:Uncharacterized protein n=1 Tax=Dufourea novaeangliae TaxID=178035 RepID=A0A154NXE6_DUFNO|nr:hypothetical protein WN55_02690 [Dufourea novaeangliae]
MLNLVREIRKVCCLGYFVAGGTSGKLVILYENRKGKYRINVSRSLLRFRDNSV